MKKFEEELVNQNIVPIGATVKTIQEKLTNHFGDWISPEDHQAKVEELDKFKKDTVDFIKKLENDVEQAKIDTFNTYAKEREELINKNMGLNSDIRSVRDEFDSKNDEIAEVKRENQCLKAENMAIKVLMDNAKKQKPEIPEFVAEDVENFRETQDSGDGVLDYSNYVKNKTDEWLMKPDNQVKFMKALITGNFTVAKEKRFYLKDKLTGMYLYKMITGDSKKTVAIYWNTVDDAGRIGVGNYLFTQQEIDSMETGSYEQIPVEEVN